MGAQTARAIALYPAQAGGRFGDYPALLSALIAVKRGAAATNAAIGALPADRARAIDVAGQGALSVPALHFPVHALHGGGGVSFNMNVNEVLANLANRDGFGRAFGSYDPIHPNDHVNLNHSTSDAFSTACHIAARQVWAGLGSQIAGLIADLRGLCDAWGAQRKLARTCLQDAVDIRFGDYLGGVVANLQCGLDRAQSDALALRRVNLGGNIIGRSQDCDPAFFARAIDDLNRVLSDGGLPADLSRSDDLFAASQAHEGLLNLAASLEQLARGLIRFAKDLRLMASGPHCGLSELRLPAVQPGSSAIPGKINPTLPEFMIQMAMTACGRAAAIRMTQDHGELDYSPWQSVVIVNLLDMMALLDGGIASLRRHCVQGMLPDAARNDANADSLLPLLIRLKQVAGYSAASGIAKQAGGDLAVIRQHIARLSEPHNDKEGTRR